MQRASALDRYVAGHSAVHRLDPRVKVVGAVLFAISNTLLPDGAWAGFLIGLAVVVAISTAAGLGPLYALPRSFVALPFALAAVSTVVTVPGESLGSVVVGPWQFTATAPGLTRFVTILLRALLSVQMAILLTATTPFPDLAHALRHLRVPGLIVTIVALMYRYLFVLVDEAGRLLRARESRSARPHAGGGGSLVWRAGVTGAMVGQLFLRSYERADRVHAAMLARGYRGEHLTSSPHVMHRRDWIAAAIALAGIVAVQAAGRLA